MAEKPCVTFEPWTQSLGIPWEEGFCVYALWRIGTGGVYARSLACGLHVKKTQNTFATSPFYAQATASAISDDLLLWLAMAKLVYDHWFLSFVIRREVSSFLSWSLHGVFWKPKYSIFLVMPITDAGLQSEASLGECFLP